MSDAILDCPPAATRRDWLGLCVIALPCLLYSMDLTVLNLALPALSARLHPTGSEQLWIVDVYGFLVAGSLITMGTLGDRIGRRKLLLIGAAAFGATSVLAAFASSAPLLIATRALLGIAGATLAPSTLSLLRSMFLRSSERTLAIGVWITSYSVGAAVGPLLGGLVLQHFWPGAVFLIGVPAMLLLLAVGPTLLPEARDPTPGKLDLASASLSLCSVLSLVFGLKWLAEHGPGLTALVAVALGISLGGVFVRRQRHLPIPLLDLSLFRRADFTVAVGTYGLGALASFGIFVLIGQYLQLVLGLSPQVAGYCTLPFAVSFIIGSLLTQPLAQRVRPGVLLPSGLLLATLGFVLLTQLGRHAGPELVMLSFVLFSLGLAPVFTLSSDLVVGSAPPERAGSAAAISETGAELGGALGIALMGSIATFCYQRALSSEPGAAAQLVAQHRTLSDALSLAGSLPTLEAEHLVASARAAFTHALEVAAGVAALISLSLSVGSWRLLRAQPASKT